MTYRNQTTAPITGQPWEHVIAMPYVIENVDDDSLIIYLESDQNRALYLEDPTEHTLEHYS